VVETGVKEGIGNKSNLTIPENLLPHQQNTPVAIPQGSLSLFNIYNLEKPKRRRKSQTSQTSSTSSTAATPKQVAPKTKKKTQTTPKGGLKPVAKAPSLPPIEIEDLTPEKIDVEIETLKASLKSKINSKKTPPGKA
jgi:hypothetical protein